MGRPGPVSAQRDMGAPRDWLAQLGCASERAVSGDVHACVWQWNYLLLEVSP